MCCATFGRLRNEEKVKSVNKRFDFVFLHGDKAVGFVSTGLPYNIPEPITKTFRGVAHTYLCTKSDVYSTDKLEAFDKKGGD